MGISEKPKISHVPIIQTERNLIEAYSGAHLFRSAICQICYSAFVCIRDVMPYASSKFLSSAASALFGVRHLSCELLFCLPVSGMRPQRHRSALVSPLFF